MKINTVYNNISHSFFNVKLNTSVLSICFILFSITVFSQTSDSASVKSSKYDNPEHTSEDYMSLNKGWYIGADVGATLYYGDVALYNNLPKFGDYKKSVGRGVSVFGGKKFKFGLAAEAQVFKGTLKGEKQADKLYRRYFKADYMGYSISARYNLSQLIFRNKNDRKFFNRLTLYANVGVGQIFFRSRLYKLAGNDQWYLERVSGFSSSGIDSAGIGQAGGLVQDKAKTVSAIILPIGGKVSFKLNSKTNVVLDISYVTAFTDQIDSWSRSWSHKDRYLYTGIGLIYNFGTAKDEDIPASDRLLRPKSNDDQSKEINDGYEKSSHSGDGSKKTGLFKKKNKKEDKDLEIKLKLYELQLKLFEMQYLVE